MEIKTKAKDRKELVKVLSEHFGKKAVYAGPPTFAYKIGAVTIDREGLIILEDENLKSEIMAVLFENEMTDEAPEKKDAEASGNAEPDELTVRISIRNMKPQGIINLINMLHSKQHLINRAIGQNGFSVPDSLAEDLSAQTFENTESLMGYLASHGACEGVAFSDGDVIFTGFPYPPGGESSMPYAKLASAMVRKASEQKRVNPKATLEENEKYYMRAWLVSIGFGGKNGKDMRGFFLKNLKGHTAFRTPEDEEKWKANRKAAKEAVQCSE